MASDKEVQMIMSLTGVDEETASAAFMRYESMEDAIDALILKPTVAGDKYIPPKRKIDTGMTPEQEERCKKGRWLQDKVNVVFSVAHSKTQTQRDEVVPEASTEPQTVELPAVESPQQPDVPEKTIPLNPQCESPP